MYRFWYTAYAYNEEQYGPVFISIDDYEVPIIDMFLFLYDQYQEGYVTLDADLDDQLTSLYDTAHDAQLQLRGDDYSRFVLDLSLPAEGQETYDAMDEIRGIAAKYFGKDNVILVGNSTSDHDLESSFASDNIVINGIDGTICYDHPVFHVPVSGASGVLLVLTIQGSIWINFAVPAMRGQTIFFIAYLIVSAIQMGATIDYAIVISSRYMDLKQRMPIKDAITESLNQAFPTIFTSNDFDLCRILIGEIASDPTVASIGVALGRGTLISIILVLFVFAADPAVW